MMELLDTQSIEASPGARQPASGCCDLRGDRTSFFSPGDPVEVNSALSGGTGEQTIARAFKAVLGSELGHSRPEIGAQAAAYAHQEKGLAQLAIGPTQKTLRSGDGVSTPIPPNKCVGKHKIGGADPADQSQPPDKDLSTGRELEHGQLWEAYVAIES